jgi:hypothetical protein
MTTDPKLVAELRALFRGGATPSRLVWRIVARHGGEPQMDRLVRAYFREAFGVLMFRASADLLTLPPEELPFAGINASTIHQIVARRAEWDSSSEPSWMDGLPASGAGQPSESAQRLTATARHLHEQVAILSRLVEQLQGQVVALEGNDSHEFEPQLLPTEAA